MNIGDSEVEFIYQVVTNVITTKTLYSAGTSFFIPVFLYPVNYPLTNSFDECFVLFSGFKRTDTANTFVQLLTDITKSTIDTTDYLSITADANITVENLDITFDIYKIYF